MLLYLGPTQPPIQWLPGAITPGVKHPGRETGHSLHPLRRLRVHGAITPLPAYVFMAWCSIKQEMFLWRGTLLSTVLYLVSNMLNEKIFGYLQDFECHL